MYLIVLVRASRFGTHEKRLLINFPPTKYECVCEPKRTNHIRLPLIRKRAGAAVCEFSERHQGVRGTHNHDLVLPYL